MRVLKICVSASRICLSSAGSSLAEKKPVNVEEGLELNVLGLSVGVDPKDGALRLPGFGQVGGAPGGAR